jgi:hypothetical protein
MADLRKAYELIVYIKIETTVYALEVKILLLAVHLNGKVLFEVVARIDCGNVRRIVGEGILNVGVHYHVVTE